MMKFGIVQFPGSTGVDDLKEVLGDYCKQEVIVIWHMQNEIPPVDAIFIPGGNSFADYPRPGQLAGNTPIMERVADFTYSGGMAIGLGNGFQILCAAGLLPGTFVENKGGSFMCDNSYVKADNNDTALTIFADKDKALHIPIAHLYGNYFLDKDILSIMRQNHQILFRYCDKEGRISEAINPDGSVENIAGVCNVNKNIYGLMLHPERAIHEEIGSIDGRVIFEGILRSLKS